MTKRDIINGLNNHIHSLNPLYSIHLRLNSHLGENRDMFDLRLAIYH